MILNNLSIPKHCFILICTSSSSSSSSEIYCFSWINTILCIILLSLSFSIHFEICNNWSLNISINLFLSFNEWSPKSFKTNTIFLLWFVKYFNKSISLWKILLSFKELKYKNKSTWFFKLKSFSKFSITFFTIWIELPLSNPGVSIILIGYKGW